MTAVPPVPMAPAASDPGEAGDRMHAAEPAARAAALREHYPVLIIGGGINGAGLFRELSLQGIDCLLVDRGDWGAGASAAPSRLIHGGIKYLETGQFRLVHQSTLERNLLLRNAPHCVAPIETLLPIRSLLGGIIPVLRRVVGLRAPLADRGLVVAAAGVTVFDWFGRRQRVLPRSRVWLGRRLRRACPDLAGDIIAAAIYHDAKVTGAERLVVELVLDGAKANAGSLALNHTAVESARDGRLVLRDAATDLRHSVAADIVVNAAGAAIDAVNRRIGLETRHISGQKGSHLVVANARLGAALGGRMVYFGASDGRVALLYPFGANVLVGSTDIPVANDDDPVCEDSERDYMIGVVREVFPAIPIRAEEVVYTYAGVRPLPRSDASDPGAVSRDHVVREDRLPGTRKPVLSLVGGKWTTFRGFAEEVADDLLRRLGRDRRVDTKRCAIGGGAGYPREAGSGPEPSRRSRRAGSALSAPKRCSAATARGPAHSPPGAPRTRTNRCAPCRATDAPKSPFLPPMNA